MAEPIFVITLHDVIGVVILGGILVLFAVGWTVNKIKEWRKKNG